MCSALPSPGSAITLRVSFVEMPPKTPLVRLWGLYGERREAYLRLTGEIQARVGPRVSSIHGGDGSIVAVGELCLVELGGQWHRCCVVSQQGEPNRDYRVFLLDEGRTVSAGAYYLARGPSELFHLPSEVLGCIVADLVPAGGVRATMATTAQSLKGLTPLGAGLSNFSWSAAAAEFLGFLHGKEVSGLVREVLIAQCLVVLELPWLSAQMQDLGLANRISPRAFRTLLSSFLLCSGEASRSPDLSPTFLQDLAANRPQLDSTILDYFCPRLELKVAEPVLVTHISDPYRLYCQLHSFSREIQLLSDVMYQTFEKSKGKDLQEPFLIPGSPCAAQGIDGCWYRAVLLEVCLGDSPVDKPGSVAQVIYVDYGRKEFVAKRNLRHLPVECFRMPVVTYPCSLQGITDGGCGWARSQINHLKRFLLGKVVQAHIGAYCPFEHLYYVTFYGENGLNLNSVYGVQARCLASLFHSSQEHTSDLLAGQEHKDTSILKKSGCFLRAAPLPVVRLKAGECYRVQVSFLQDPSVFWVYLQEHHQPLCDLEQDLSNCYSQKLEGFLLEPKPGSLCCVMLKENCYYRAFVTKVQGKGIEVFLVDRGSTEIVDLYRLKVLLPQFMEFPAVALRCALPNYFSSGHLWSPDAVDCFRKAVLNKELAAQVLSVQEDVYIVELFDHSLSGEEKISKTILLQRFAQHHKDEVQVALKVERSEPLKSAQGEDRQQKLVKQRRKDELGPLSLCDCSAPYSFEVSKVRHRYHKDSCFLPHKISARGDSSTALSSSVCDTQNIFEIKPEFSWDGQLEVGTTVDVVVSYAESPSNFCCQLVKNSQDLDLLMAKIQKYCTHSAQPHDWTNPVCLAKYSEDNKWYRAIIVNKICYTEEVEVVYIDYGNKERVSLNNVRATKEEFLKLNAQAFRCSLYNLIQPNGQDPFVWDEKASEAFHKFVETGSKLELKCTIFALASLNNTELFNIVDLLTPFESACHFLTRENVARFVQPQNFLIPSVRLLSYYYSTHDIKTGNEEIVYVTHVNDPCFFYCQLAKSANALKQLTSSIGKLSKKWHILQASETSGNLYLARYTDGCWYRATVISVKATKKVFFVDFGNTQLLKNEDLVLIPNDAYELLFLPMQAIKCSLCDVADVPKAATVWFEKRVLHKPLKALIVAKEPDGKLVIELYDGKMKINAKLKEIISLHCSKGMSRYIENGTSLELPVSKGADTEKKLPLKKVDRSASEVKNQNNETLEITDISKGINVCREACQLQQKTRSKLTKKFLGLVENINKSDFVTWRKGRDVLQKTGESSDSCENGNPGETSTLFSLKNISDLPQKIINVGLKTLVYISHINNPSDFYVHLVEDEPLLDSISESLNNSKIVKSLNDQQLHIGDLICAVFSEDGLWYRAIVKKEPSLELLNVQYIDYGNTGCISMSDTCRLPESCLSFPAMGIHCSLSGVKATEWTQEAVLYFSERTSDLQIHSEFMEKTGSKWEILFYDEDSNITVDLIKCNSQHQKSLVDSSGKDSNVDLIDWGEANLSNKCNKPPVTSDSKLFIWKVPKIGQTVKTFLVVTKSPNYFWCQFADKDVIGSVATKLQEVGELVEINAEDIKSGCPCLVKNSTDKMLYRAVVSNIEMSSLRVIHIDYGIEELTCAERIGQIYDELLTIPPQAFLCCLFGFDRAEGSWAEGINNTFCDMIVNSLLEVTVIEKQNDGPPGIPMFIVKLECQNISINEKMKPFWKLNTEDSDSALANVYESAGKGRAAEKESSEASGFQAEMLTRALMAPDTGVSEDQLCCSEIFQPRNKFIGGSDNHISFEIFPTSSPECQIRHNKVTSKMRDIREWQNVFESSENKRSLSDKESGMLNCVIGSEVHLRSCKTEVLKQDVLEIQKEVVRQTEMYSLEDQLLLDDAHGMSESKVPASSGKPLPGKLGTFKDTVQLESAETSVCLCDETQEISGLDLLEMTHVEEKVESPSQRDKIDGFMMSEVRALQVEEAREEKLPLELPATSVPAGNEIQSLSETKLRLQNFPSTEDLVKECEKEQCNKKDKSVECQTLLEKSCGETQRSHEVCERGKHSNCFGENYLSVLLDEKAVETSSLNAGKNETPYNLKGFDTGSKCMVWSGVHWYKAEILDVSNEGTEVLNLSSGNEEVVDPVDIWDQIPELDSSLTEEAGGGGWAKMEDAVAPMLDNKMGALHSVAKPSVGNEVEEVIDTLEGNTRSFVM